MQGYSAEMSAQVKGRKDEIGPVVSESSPVVDVICIPLVAKKDTFKVARDYVQYCVVSDGDKGTPADVSADVVDYLDEIFGQDGL